MSSQQPPKPQKPGSRFGADFVPHDKAQTRTYVVPLRGLNTEDPGRTADPGDAETASNVWFKRGGFEALPGRTQFGNQPWGSADAKCHGLFEYKVQGFVPAQATLNADAEDNDAAGQLVAGSFYYIAYTGYDPVNGDETSFSPFGGRTFVGASTDNVIKMDTPANATMPARFTQIRWYRSKADEIGLRYEATAALDPQSAHTDQAVGIVADGSLGALNSVTGVRTTLKYLCMVSSAGVTTLYESLGGNWFTAGTMTADNFHSGVQYGNRMFFVGGAGVQVWDDSSLYSIASFSPAQATLNADPEDDNGTDHLFAGGFYYIAYTGYDPLTGDETNPSPFGGRTFVGAGTDDVIMMDTPSNAGMPARFTQTKWYRSKKNEVGLRYEQTVDVDPHSAQNNGGGGFPVGIIADSALGPLLDVRGGWRDGPPGDTRGVHVWDDRVWYYGSDANPTTLYFSVRGLGTAVPSTPLPSTLVLDEISGPTIRALLNFDSKMFAFKENQGYAIGFSPITDYAARELERGFGAISPLSAHVESKQMIGIGSHSLWAFDGVTYKILSSKFASQILSTNNRFSFGGFNAPVDMAITGDPRNPYILIAADNLAADQELLISMTGIDCSIGPTKTRRMLMVEGTRGVRWPLVAYDDGAGADLKTYYYIHNATGVRIAPASQVSTWQSKPIDPDPFINEKQFEALEILTAKPTVDGTFDVTVLYDDGKASETHAGQVAYGAGAETTQVVRVPLAMDTVYQTFAVKITWTGTQTIDIRSMRMLWKPIGDYAPK